MATKTELELLDDVLAAYGSDRTRWPARQRRDLSQLLSSSEAAQAMVGQAQALDRLLDMAPAVAPERLSAWSDKIMAQAVRTPRMVRSAPAALPPPKPAPVWKRHAVGISALAASLVLGLLAGQYPTVSPAFSEIASVAGIDSLGDSGRVAPADEAYVSLEEDVL